MTISFDKEKNETKIWLSIGDKKEKFEYLQFRNYLFLGKTLDKIIFSENFSEEEKREMTKMINNICNTAVKKDDLSK